MTALLVVNCGVLGLLIGSFLNVVIHRVPAGRSVVAPPSACGTCEMRLTPSTSCPCCRGSRCAVAVVTAARLGDARSSN